MQRVPVKIVLDDQRLTGLLRPGMSAVPTVDTKATVLAERETQARLASDTALSPAERRLSARSGQDYQSCRMILSRLPRLSKPSA